MKTTTISIALALLPLAANADLILTGVYDGPLTGGIPKGVEVYATSDIADLSLYGLGGANNGGGSDGEEFTFPAVSVSAGTYLYIASEATGFEAFFGFAPDYTSSAMSINGDDAIELFKNGQLLDIFGEVDVDGTGTDWEYMDGWAHRMPGSSASILFDIGEWSFSGANAWDNESDNSSALAPYPLASFGGSVGGGNTAVLINEVDADTDGTDVLEFVELYDGGAGNTDLSGLTVVFYNGSDDASYQSFDLDGYSTNSAGFFVLGNPGVTNVDLIIGSSNILQNGADAVALVVGDAVDYPNDTPVATASLQDAIVYGTNDADDAGLLVLLNAGEAQVNESAGAGSTLDSSQRCDDGSGGARNTASYIQAAPTPGVANQCSLPAELTLISAIQGTPATQIANQYGETDVSPLFGTTVTVEAVVTADFQNGDADETRNLNGFFIQEETADDDGDPASSEGIFIYHSATDVNVGDLVRLTATVDQYYGESQLSSVQDLVVLATDQLASVTPASVSLLGNSAVTVNQDGRYQPDLEAWEGMLVTLQDAVQISEQYQLDRFNEIRVTAGSRPVQFTQLNTPDAQLLDLWARDQGARTLIYDDGLNVQNANVSLLQAFAPYNEASARRMGDTATGLTGVLDYKWAGNSASGATWRLRAHLDDLNTFTSTANGDSPNPRPTSAPEVDANLKITSFNVLNFFKTLDESGVVTAAGHDPRGADTQAEFDRQLQKTVNAIAELNADVLGLVELENEFDAINDGSTAIEVLVNALNTQLGAEVYAYVYPGSTFVGSDAIATGFIYKPAVVSLANGSAPAQLDDSVAATLPVFSSRDFAADPIFNGEATNRVSLAASFTHLATGDSFTVVANHFKSKGSSGLSDTASPNYDQANGAGFWNQRRLDAATAVIAWLETSPTGLVDDDVVLLGDLNAYAMEAPVQYLLDSGFNNVEDNSAYSYVFDGQVGTLDYILLSDSLYSKFTEAGVWHVNSDEADALDYNLDFGKSADYFDGTTATRNSDHDPVLVGLDMAFVATSPLELSLWLMDQSTSGSISGASRHPVVSDIFLALFDSILKSAESANQRGRTAASCQLLNLAARLSDGKPAPRDLVMGDGVAELNGQIANVRVTMGCR